MPFAEVGRERLYYELSGDGPPLVLIRGLSRSLRFWDRLLPHLEGRFRLLTYDHRGIGRSPIVGKRFSIADLANDLAGVISESGVGRAHVFGMSLGGMVAMQLALDHPQHVDKLVLGATTAGTFQRAMPRVDTLAFLGVTAVLPKPLQCRLQAPRLMSPRFSKANPGVAAGWVPHLEREPIDGKVVVQQALAGARHDVTRRLHEIQSDVLVITGDADRLIPDRHSRRLARGIAGSRLVVLPGVGHDLAAEAPADLASELCGFLLRDEVPARAEAVGE